MGDEQTCGQRVADQVVLQITIARDTFAEENSAVADIQDLQHGLGIDEIEVEIRSFADDPGCRRGGMRGDGAVEHAEFVDKAEEWRVLVLAVFPSEVLAGDKVAK